MRIFVTGGSGFVGGHLIEALSMTPSHTVSAMARSDRSATVVADFGATPVRCSLDDVTAEHLAGCEVVIHAAAFVEPFGTRAQFHRANVDGTQRMLDAAIAAGVRRFIHVGTEAVLFDGSPLVGVDETAPYPSKHRFIYSETKAEAERRVLAANAPDFTTLSIRPRMIWGPRDASVLPTLLHMVKTGRFRWLDGGKHLTSTTHVANLVHGLILALDRGRGGQAYFITDVEDSTIRAFLTQLLATAGVTVDDKGLPGWIASSAAAVIEGWWRLWRLKSQPPMTRFAIAMMLSEVTVRCDKAAAELGYAPTTSVARGMEALTRRGESP